MPKIELLLCLATGKSTGFLESQRCRFVINEWLCQPVQTCVSTNPLCASSILEFWMGCYLHKRVLLVLCSKSSEQAALSPKTNLDRLNRQLVLFRFPSKRMLRKKTLLPLLLIIFFASIKDQQPTLNACGMVIFSQIFRLV